MMQNYIPGLYPIVEIVGNQPPAPSQPTEVTPNSNSARGSSVDTSQSDIPTFKGGWKSRPYQNGMKISKPRRLKLLTPRRRQAMNDFLVKALKNAGKYGKPSGVDLLKAEMLRELRLLQTGPSGIITEQDLDDWLIQNRDFCLAIKAIKKRSLETTPVKTNGRQVKYASKNATQTFPRNPPPSNSGSPSQFNSSSTAPRESKTQLSSSSPLLVSHEEKRLFIQQSNFSYEEKMEEAERPASHSSLSDDGGVIISGETSTVPSSPTQFTDATEEVSEKENGAITLKYVSSGSSAGAPMSPPNHIVFPGIHSEAQQSQLRNSEQHGPLNISLQDYFRLVRECTESLKHYHHLCLQSGHYDESFPAFSSLLNVLDLYASLYMNPKSN